MPLLLRCLCLSISLASLCAVFFFALFAFAHFAFDSKNDMKHVCGNSILCTKRNSTFFYLVIVFHHKFIQFRFSLGSRRCPLIAGLLTWTMNGFEGCFAVLINDNETRDVNKILSRYRANDLMQLTRLCDFSLLISSEGLGHGNRRMSMMLSRLKPRYIYFREDLLLALRLKVKRCVWVFWSVSDDVFEEHIKNKIKRGAKLDLQLRQMRKWRSREWNCLKLLILIRRKMWFAPGLSVKLILLKFLGILNNWRSFCEFVNLLR